ncbi:alpha-amylase family glycosyl hydrolase [Nonlabens xiamenensis]|uniref:alpha-amylase family glycosyl hydrolase n=1 Tax=Nonlabens xiamenensis TaxID=2341043 RepID=UPI000F6088FC|nr:alpha-amylase family glycosyl hydrolase [Nonlabens xiamenensis]
MKRLFVLLMACTLTLACKEQEKNANDISGEQASNQANADTFDWGSANLYFLLTDRFFNGDPTNDQLIKRDLPTGTLRGFQGGDFAGISQKLDEGYFEKLGVNAIWITPIWEQIHGGVDEGTGYSYGFHGYWAKDWTTTEPSYGTIEEYQEMVDKAHAQGIRVLMDVVLNHTGPVTDQDPQWPEEWVRTGPVCTYQDQSTAVTCTLTNNLPDIRTESSEPVDLPPSLAAKWKKEGRYEKELSELDAFFEQSGLARTPVNYIIKWITDYARETGVDGFRVDTVKHVEEEVWATLNEQARLAYQEWRDNNPNKVYHNDEFFIVGELYNYEVANGREFGFSDGPVDYFDYGYDAMINFGFKREATMPYEQLFATYDKYRDSLQAASEDQQIYFMNYISSHDDGQPFDPNREKTYESATKLLLSPGMAQIYYGDETGRSLVVPNAVGDATLRSVMEWPVQNTQLLSHWQKLGQFRKAHPAVGAGDHFALNHDGEGTIAARFYEKDGVRDDVIIGAGLPEGMISIDVRKVFPNAKTLYNAYTHQELAVENGYIKTSSENGVVLLEVPRANIEG